MFLQPMVLELSMGCTASVYPMGFRHLQRFGTALTGLLGALGATPTAKAAKPQQVGDAISAAVVPYAMSHLLDLVAECTKVTGPDGQGVKIEDLPHWMLPRILEAWVEINLGERDKWLPWIAAVDRMASRLTGKPPADLRTLFSSSSQPGTTAATSSTGASPGAPTADGPSNSSAPTSEQPAGAST